MGGKITIGGVIVVKEGSSGSSSFGIAPRWHTSYSKLYFPAGVSVWVMMELLFEIVKYVCSDVLYFSAHLRDSVIVPICVRSSIFCNFSSFKILRLHPAFSSYFAMILFSLKIGGIEVLFAKARNEEPHIVAAPIIPMVIFEIFIKMNVKY